MYCLLTDNLVDLYLLTVLKLLVRTHGHIWRKLTPFAYELDVVVIKKKHLLNMTVIKLWHAKALFNTNYKK